MVALFATQAAIKQLWTAPRFHPDLSWTFFI